MMADETAFPGIQVKRIYTGSKKPSEGGIVDTLTKEISKITPEYIKKKIGGSKTLTYELKIKAMSETSAKAKGRAFVRIKNPFEPSEVIISKSDKVESGNLMNDYDVTLSVMK